MSQKLRFEDDEQDLRLSDVTDNDSIKKQRNLRKLKHEDSHHDTKAVNSQIKSGKNLTLNKGVFEAFYLFFSNCFRKLFSFSHFNVASKVSFFIQNKTPVPKRGFYHYLHSIYFICTCFIF